MNNSAVVVIDIPTGLSVQEALDYAFLEGYKMGGDRKLQDLDRLITSQLREVVNPPVFYIRKGSTESEASVPAWRPFGKSHPLHPANTLKIADLQVPARCVNALKAADIHMVGELPPWVMIRSIRNMGDTSVRHLRAALECRNISLD